MAVLQGLLLLVSLFVGGEAVGCYNSYYSTYSYYCEYYSYYSYYEDGPGGIIGGVVGGLFGLGTLIALIVVCICCRRRQASMGHVVGNQQGTAVTMVTQQTNQGYPAAPSGGYPAAGQPAGYPAAGQPVAAYPAAGQPAAYPNTGYPPAPAGQYQPPVQQQYPLGSQPYPQQTQAAPAFDNNTAPMAGGGGFTNPGFQPPPPYDQVANEKK